MTGTILDQQEPFSVATIDSVEVYFDKTTGNKSARLFINKYGGTEIPNNWLSTVKFYDKDTEPYLAAILLF